MTLFYAVFLLLPYFCTCNHIPVRDVFHIDVTYEELQELNATCKSDVTCEPGHVDFSASKCNCGISCAQLGTCCVTSPYKLVPVPTVKPKCRLIANATIGYLMIDQCPQSSRSKSAYADLCREDREGENDLLRMVPVTSLYTHITYKNYFCFLCHESNDDHVFWNVQILFDGETDVTQDDPNVQLAYDEYYSTWVAPVGKGGSFAPVNLDFEIPLSIHSMTKTCSHSLITECSENWEDDDVRAKCNTYMHVININRNGKFWEYKNPHCALCNNEILDNKICPEDMSFGFGGGKRPFSFTYLLDINRSDGDKVGKIERCSGNDVWDPFFKKCRTLKCALPGYIVKEGKCVPP